MRLIKIQNLKEEKNKSTQFLNPVGLPQGYEGLTYEKTKKTVFFLYYLELTGKTTACKTYG